MVAELALVPVVLAAVASPHVLRLELVAPMRAAAVWLSALLVRAVVAVGGAFFMLVYLPETGVFAAVARWCLHEVVPLLATHLGVSGHPLAHAAIVLPALVLAVSIMWLLFGLARAWIALKRQLRGALGEGPAGSTVIDDRSVVVALTALGKPRMVLSQAALEALDGDELHASLAHERGHLRRGHRPLLMLASLLSALARPLPGTRRAERELIFHLERDADEFAVRETRDPLALASAICKAAQSQAALLTGLAGDGRVTSRLDILVDGGAPRSRRLGAAAAGLATLLAALALALAASVTDSAVASIAAAPGPSAETSCPH